MMLIEFFLTYSTKPSQGVVTAIPRHSQFIQFTHIVDELMGKLMANGEVPQFL